MKASRSHHLAKHSLASEVDVKLHFGSTDPKEIAREISKLGQKQLQAKFNQLFSAKTYSNNNQWLRRKLLEAAGIQAPKALGRSRPVQPRRSSSPAVASTSSSGPSCDTGATCSTPASSSHRNARLAPPQTGKVEVRRTKRQRRPRTFDDMLMLDSPVCSSDSRSLQDSVIPDVATPRDGMRQRGKAVSALSLYPGQSAKWSRDGSTSRFSELSSESGLPFSRLFEGKRSGGLAYAPRYHPNSPRLQLPADCLDEQLLRASSMDSTSDLLASFPASGYCHSFAGLHRSMPGSPRLPMGLRSPHSCPQDSYDLGASRVRIATPHNRLAPSRTVNIHLTIPRDEPGHLAHVPDTPASPELVEDAQRHAAAVQDRRAVLPRDAEAFANSLLDAEALVPETRMHPAEWQAGRLAYSPQPTFLNTFDTTEAAAVAPQEPAPVLLAEAAGSPSASSLGSDSSLCLPAHDNLEAGPTSPRSAASTTPMDMIMLQGLGALPLDGLACSSAEPLMADPMFLLDPLLPPAAT